MFKKNEKHIVTAILIEKNSYDTHHISNEVSNLRKMKLGSYHVSNAKKTTQKVYQLVFMTKKGSKKFFVHRTVFSQIDLNALGTLEYQKQEFLSFEIDKIATKEDVKNLNW